MFGICVKPVLYLWNNNKQIKNQKTNIMKKENLNSINLTKKIMDIINFASHQFDMGNASEANFQLNVAKSLIQNNINKELFVSREYVDTIVDEVSNWE